ncbi:hypothetical protein FZEAL_3090 [Fusarium zealandicum]|uniref:F-box domain-containing protein n=1 Tax=Fusarium zealandicum TaxID=1053134 RepID=A0A8H4UQB6_9HYPO|nr:hypothetical protein FZEAL_3090 [Fusarium zealandicum]
MSRTALLDLPTEIYQTIFGHFCAHCTPGPELTSLRKGGVSASTRRTLAALSQSCRSLHQVATPLLYHEVVGDAWQLDQALDFLRTISQRPDLAACVRHFSLGKYPTHPGQHWLSIKKLAKSRGVLLPFKNPPHYEDPRLSGLLFDISLSLVPHVQKLGVTVFSGGDYGNYLPSSTRLSSLKELRLSLEDDYAESLQMSDFAMLFKMTPSLENLEVGMCFSAFRGVALGNLKTLKLKNSILKLKDLRDVAVRCTKLETFIFHTSMTEEQAPSGLEHFAPRQIVQALTPRKGTLRHLEIQCDWEPFTSVSPKGLVTSVKELTALETLYLDVNCLCYGSTDDFEQAHDTVAASLMVGLLPASIKTVIIDGDRSSLYEPILKLARHAQKGALPQLGNFKVTGFHSSFPPFSFHKVGAAMEAAGIVFEASEKSIFLP